jgi:dTDP-glucose pyrophosphorylase
MNILILAAGTISNIGETESYPPCLTESDGVPLIERILHTCQTLMCHKLIIALRAEDIRRYHLDNIVTLLSPGAYLLRINQATSGAACTALLAINEINSDEQLVILNANELLDESYVKIVTDFRNRALDAGVVTFPSVHPRYSYVRVGADNLVVEASEKNPISRMATAGFYWFAKGSAFVMAAQNMIRKGAAVNDLYYICPALNELVLEHARIGTYAVEAANYKPLKTDQQLVRFEASRS